MAPIYVLKVAESIKKRQAGHFFVLKTLPVPISPGKFGTTQKLNP